MATRTRNQGRPRRDPAYILKTLMRARGVTATALAAHLGLAPSGLTDRFKGETEIKASELLTAAEYLNVDPAVFFEDVDEFDARFSYPFGRSALSNSPYNSDRAGTSPFAGLYEDGSERARRYDLGAIEPFALLTAA